MMATLILLLLLCLMTAIGFMRPSWLCSIFDYPRLTYCYFSALLFLVFISGGNYMGALLSLAVMAINLFQIRYYLPQLKKRHTHHNKTILSANAWKDNDERDKFKNFIVESNADLMLIMEMTEDLEGKLSDVLSHYPHRLTAPVRDGFSIGLYSKNPLSDTKIDHYGDNNTPLLRADVTLKGKEYRIYSAHPKPGLNKKWYKERQAYFDEIQHAIRGQDKPIIMLGDFNSVPWERHFVNFVKQTKLKSTLRGYGYRVTWPTYFFCFGVPMDHILISENVDYNGLCIGPYTGSDHYPISLNLSQ